MNRIRLPDFLAPAVATTHAPHVRSWWSSRRISVALLLALAPPTIAALAASRLALVIVFGVCIATVLAWQALFAAVQRTRMDADGIVTAIMFGLMVPVAAPLWQVVLGLSFGVVIGELIFGGRGRNILNPVVVGLAFLIFSFPNGGYDAAGSATALMSLPGAVLLLAGRLISWRIVVGALVGLAVPVWLLAGGDPLAAVMTGGFVFAVIFLACDPVCAAATNPGRYVYGLLAGFLVFLGRTGGEGAVDGVVFAVLVAQIFAPLTDYFVIAINGWLRRRRYG